MKGAFKHICFLFEEGSSSDLMRHLNIVDHGVVFFLDLAGLYGWVHGVSGFHLGAELPTYVMYGSQLLGDIRGVKVGLQL